MTEAEIAAIVDVVKKAQVSVRPRKKTKRASKSKLSDSERAAFMARNNAECVSAFTAAGYKDVKPRVNVLTYKKWLEKGRKVREGEKSVRVGMFALFHEDQTDDL